MTTKNQKFAAGQWVRITSADARFDGTFKNKKAMIKEVTDSELPYYVEFDTPYCGARATWFTEAELTAIGDPPASEPAAVDAGEENSPNRIDELAAKYVAAELERAKTSLLEFGNIDIDALQAELTETKHDLNSTNDILIGLHEAFLHEEPMQRFDVLAKRVVADRDNLKRQLAEAVKPFVQTWHEWLDSDDYTSNEEPFMDWLQATCDSELLRANWQRLAALAEQGGEGAK